MRPMKKPRLGRAALIESRRTGGKTFCRGVITGKYGRGIARAVRSASLR
jgi:hypothetical protein